MSLRGEMALARAEAEAAHEAGDREREQWWRERLRELGQLREAVSAFEQPPAGERIAALGRELGDPDYDPADPNA